MITRSVQAGSFLMGAVLLLSACEPGPADDGAWDADSPVLDNETADGGVLPDGGEALPSPDAGQVATVHRVGRFADDGSFAYPGSMITARFLGTTLSLALQESGGNFYSVWIDGVERAALHTSGGSRTYQLVSGLAAGEHEVVVTRRTESFFGTTRFVGFSGATLVETVPPRARLIEFVGDSITAGYGVLADHPCTFSGANESEPSAYGALTAATLGAFHTAIAYSGIGVYRNVGGGAGPLAPTIFERTLADDPASTWSFSYTPEVVVVNLGTNDFSIGDPGQPFVDAYDAFIQRIRGHYPNAWIFVALSPMLSDGYPAHEMRRTNARARLTTVVGQANARGDARVIFVELAEQLSSDGFACDYHPSAMTHQKMATTLSAAIRTNTGW